MQKNNGWRTIWTLVAKPELYLSTTEKQLLLLGVALSLVNHFLWAVWDLSYKIKTSWTNAWEGIYSLLHRKAYTHSYTSPTTTHVHSINTWWGLNLVYCVLYEIEGKKGTTGSESSRGALRPWYCDCQVNWQLIQNMDWAPFIFQWLHLHKVQPKVWHRVFASWSIEQVTVFPSPNQHKYPRSTHSLRAHGALLSAFP